LVHEEVQFDVPYARGVEPVVGREALVGMFTKILGGLFDRLDLSITALYPGSDADVLVVEYGGQATVIATGRPYANQYIGVFRQQDGLLSLWREYFNPDITAQAMKAPAGSSASA
jgi:uncharacterized protein